MRIPINDLKRHHDPLANELADAVKRVMSRGWYILGPEVEAFEAEFASYCGVPHCIGVGNGTDALELALLALGIGPGSRSGHRGQRRHVRHHRHPAGGRACPCTSTSTSSR